MVGSTPIYDQFARSRASARSIQPVQESLQTSSNKHSISIITAAPIDYSQQKMGRSRPQSHAFVEEQPQSHNISCALPDRVSSQKTTDLKHSRSQSHALLPLKRKVVNGSNYDAPRRTQSVLDSRTFPPRKPNLSSLQDSTRETLATPNSTEDSQVSTSNPPSDPKFSKKFVVVGDGGSGKTCLLMRYKERTFPDKYVPTVFENYITHKYHRVTREMCEVALWDTAGQEEYDRLRPLSYPETDVLLVCFAIDCPQSLDSVKEKWYPEVLHFCPTTPLILVGCKSDLRDNDKAHDQLEGQGLHMLSIQQGLNIANYIGAEAYMECSSKEMVNVDEVFELAMDIAIGTEIRLDWQTTSIVGKLLSKGQLGGASQLSQKTNVLLSRDGTAAHNSMMPPQNFGFIGKGPKAHKKKRRACKVL